MTFIGRKYEQLLKFSPDFQQDWEIMLRKPWCGLEICDGQRELMELLLLVGVYGQQLYKSHRTIAFWKPDGYQLETTGQKIGTGSLDSNFGSRDEMLSSGS